MILQRYLVQANIFFTLFKTLPKTEKRSQIKEQKQPCTKLSWGFEPKEEKRKRWETNEVCVCVHEGEGSLFGNAIQASPDLFSQALVVKAAELAFVFVR